jgi:hypothetical protein
MNRAIVLIGVAKTGKLPLLGGIERSIDAMAAWAKKQGIPDANIIPITDKGGTVTVTASQILEAIDALAKRGNITQLIVYFSGHGIVNGRDEYWLLTNAPRDSNAAVNIEGSAAAARHGAFPHVVLISDACRTQAPDLLNARVNGSDIFPNVKDATVERSIDIFFATSLGAPALEIRVAAEKGPEYHAVYSDAMVGALSGRVRHVIDEGFVRPYPLKKHLPALVRAELEAKQLSILVSQTPDARITSDQEVAWVAKVDEPDTATPRPRGPGSGPGPAPPPPPVPPVPSREAVARKLVAEAIRGGSRPRSGAAAAGAPSVVIELADEAELRQKSQAELRVPTEASVLVQGKALKAAFTREAAIGTVSGESVSLRGSARPPELLVEFDDGSSVLLPVLRDFAAVVGFDGDRLDDVSFVQPGSHGDPELQELRAVIAAATARGLFTLEGEDDALTLAKRMQNSKGRDPALAVYAAYAYHELGQLERIRSMQAFLRGQIGVGLFDLALLGRDLVKDEGAANVLPSAPLLAQGWAFVAALGGPQAERLVALRPYVNSSVWSHYSPEGTRLLKEWLRFELGAE